MPISRLLDSLIRGATNARPAHSGILAILISLGGYLFLWALYGALAKASQDLHPDMIEKIVWSRESFESLKHPPLSQWLVRLWFSVFPTTDWAFYVLGILIAVITLLAIYGVSTDYLAANKRAFALALMTFIPFFNFHALKYNENTVLMPLWAITTLCFLRSYRAKSSGYGALAGAVAAAALLSKYWSIFLVAGLGLAALIDIRRGLYFRSAAPWVTIAVGLALLLPHLVWLTQNHFAPIQYGIDVHAGQQLTTTLREALSYLVGSAGYVALPVVLVVITARPNLTEIADMLWPTDADRRLVAASFWAPLLLPAVIAPVAGIAINPLWSMSAWTLLPILLLSSARVNIATVQKRRILTFAVLFPVLMVLAAPFIALAIHYFGFLPVSAYGRSVSAEVERAWREVTKAPLRYVDGDFAYQIAVYSPDRPRPLPDLPPIPFATLAEYGIATACYYDDRKCMGEASLLQRNEPRSRQFDVSMTPLFLGIKGPARPFMILIVPPRLS